MRIKSRVEKIVRSRRVFLKTGRVRTDTESPTATALEIKRKIANDTNAGSCIRTGKRMVAAAPVANNQLAKPKTSDAVFGEFRPVLLKKKYTNAKNAV